MADGSFHIITFEDQFHVIFRPEHDPQWFRIIASFYTWERAYQYWDVERVMAWEDESSVDEDEKNSPALAQPPTIPDQNPQGEGGLRELVRDIYQEADDAVPEEPLSPPFDDSRTYRFETKLPSDPDKADEKALTEAIEQVDEWFQANPYGLPASFFAEKFKLTVDESWHLIAALMDAGEAQIIHRVDSGGALVVPLGHKPPPMRMTPKQEAVYRCLLERSDERGRATASFAELAKAARVESGSVVALVDSLERKQLVRIAERGGPTKKTVFEVRRETK